MDSESATVSTPPADAPVALFKKRNAKARSNLRKRAATPPSASDSESEYSSADESGRRIKRRRKHGILTASSTAPKADLDAIAATKFEADRSAIIESFNDATKQSNWYDENAADALSAKSLLGTTRTKPGDAPASDGTYKGRANYQSFIQKNPDAPDRKVGPVKAPTNIRTITLTDYAPDVCKDYKQTGFCGFGDSCKFLHARECYKQGWALDREWEIQTKGKKVEGKTVASANRAVKFGEDEENEEEIRLLEKIPFACIICKQPYRSPIVTRCGHYFCENCALQRFRKNPNCAVCGAGTNGVFNGAKNLKKLLEKKKEREERMKDKAREEGGEVSDGQEDKDSTG